MSTYFVFPKPRDWNAFEDIVCDVFSRKYGRYNLQRYGRNGQRQNGVDIAGLVSDGVLGIQCKHHPLGNIEEDEIEKEIQRSEAFRPNLSKYVLATSADRDVKVHSFVLETSEQRIQDGTYPVEIVFWGDIESWLSDYPDLIYKHFTKFFSLQDAEHLRLPGLERRTRQTVHWPATPDKLKAAASHSTGDLALVDPYHLSISVSNFPSDAVEGVVDLAMHMEADFDELATQFQHMKSVISDAFFSKRLTVHLSARLSPSFLFGWMFRRVTGFSFELMNRGQVWASGGLPLVPSRLVDRLPLVLEQQSYHAVIVLNISRDIFESVKNFVQGWEEPPRIILGYQLDGAVESAAHALSLALEISRKIKSIMDSEEIRHVHLFSALPASLAALVAHNLNGIKPLSLYFLSEDRVNYQLAGTLTNSL